MTIYTLPVRPKKPAEAEAAAPLTDLLAPEDIVEIERYGVPDCRRADLAKAHGEDVVFSAKGIQYYRYAMHIHGIPGGLASNLSTTEFEALSAAIFGRVRTRTRARLAAAHTAGNIPAQDKELVDSKMRGSTDGYLKALRRNAAFGRAGENIIPATFKKTAPKEPR